MSMSCTFYSSKKVLWMSEDEANDIIRESIRHIVSDSLNFKGNSDLFQSDLSEIEITENIHNYLNYGNYGNMLQVCKNMGDYRDSFEGDRCDTIRDAFKKFLGKEINFESTDLSKECLEFTIDYISKANYVRLGLFRSKEHMINILQQLLDIVKKGGKVSFYCSY